MGAKVCVTAAVLALVACDHPTGPSGGGRIALVMAAAGTGMDSGYVRLSGTASRTVKLVPPATVTIWPQPGSVHRDARGIRKRSGGSFLPH